MLNESKYSAMFALVFSRWKAKVQIQQHWTRPRCCWGIILLRLAAGDEEHFWIIIMRMRMKRMRIMMKMRMICRMFWAMTKILTRWQTCCASSESPRYLRPAPPKPSPTKQSWSKRKKLKFYHFFLARNRRGWKEIQNDYLIVALTTRKRTNISQNF